MEIKNKNIIVLSRDTVAMMVPSGARILLHAGTEVTITQALGNSFTVNVFGNLARIESKDADALGREVEDPLAKLVDGASTKERTMVLLKTVFDPEIPINIVDLGLIYACDVSEIEKDQYRVDVRMTLTAPGCGMGPVIVADAKEKLLALPEVEIVEIEMVFDPPWDRSMMSPVAQLELGML